MTSYHAAIIHSLKWYLPTVIYNFSADETFLFQLTNAFQRTSWLIKSKTSSPGPCVQAGRGVVLGRRKSLELIRRKACSLFGGETAGQQDIVKIKAWGLKRGSRETSRQRCFFSSTCSVKRLKESKTHCNWSQNWNIVLRWSQKSRKNRWMSRVVQGERKEQDSDCEGWRK